MKGISLGKKGNTGLVHTVEQGKQIINDNSK